MKNKFVLLLVGVGAALSGTVLAYSTPATVLLDCHFDARVGDSLMAINRVQIKETDPEGHPGRYTEIDSYRFPELSDTYSADMDERRARENIEQGVVVATVDGDDRAYPERSQTLVSVAKDPSSKTGYSLVKQRRWWCSPSSTVSEGRAGECVPDADGKVSKNHWALGSKSVEPVDCGH
jgi:hypothetical protein